MSPASIIAAAVFASQTLESKDLSSILLRNSLSLVSIITFILPKQNKMKNYKTRSLKPQSLFQNAAKRRTLETSIRPRISVIFEAAFPISKDAD